MASDAAEEAAEAVAVAASVAASLAGLAVPGRTFAVGEGVEVVDVEVATSCIEEAELQPSRPC